jgi:DnaJ-class molecular chaperone
MSENLTNPDPCRDCGGRKGHRIIEERNGRRVEVWESCFMCEGTGLQTVRVFDEDKLPIGVWAG